MGSVSLAIYHISEVMHAVSLHPVIKYGSRQYEHTK